MTNVSADLEEAIEVAKSGGHSMVKCPAHDDGTASLHVTHGDRQPVVMTCHAGCTVEEIIAAEGLSLDVLMADPDPYATVWQPKEGEWTPAGPASHVYRYLDEDGVELFQVLRIPQGGDRKTFRQRHKGEDGRWVWNMEGVRRVLYRLPQVLQAKAEGRVIHVVEGEKDAETMWMLGEVGTTSPMGAGKWRDEYGEALAGANVVIISDADATGREHARKVKANLQQYGCSVTIMEPKPGYKDVSDMAKAGVGLDELVLTTPDQEEKRASYGVDILDAIKRSATAIEFVIPNVIAKGDRLLITGFEGHGKSNLLRQLAVMSAAGLHWWNLTDIDPVRSLFIDVENHPDQVLTSWQDLAGLAARHEHPLERDMLTLLESWDDEVDLTTSEGHDWLIERVHAYKPQIVFMGPLYNMSGRDLKDDETVRRIKSVVNEARSIYGTAFVMEHHAPHKSATDKERSVRPYGSSTFLKWPDFGYGLRPMEQEGVYEWQKTRFPRVRTRYFPEYLRWGKQNQGEFPWMEAHIDESTGDVY